MIEHLLGVLKVGHGAQLSRIIVILLFGRLEGSIPRREEERSRFWARIVGRCLKKRPSGGLSRLYKNLDTLKSDTTPHDEGEGHSDL